MFDKLEPKADKLIFNIASQEKNFCDSFIYEPINIAEEKLGNLYMLGEIKDVSEESFQIINYIATLIKRNYYANTQKPCLSALEEALKKTNEGAQELILQKKTEWIGKINFAIGVLSQNTFYFTICGNLRIFFVRHGEVTDVGEKLTTGIRETTPQKIFRSVASGRVEKEDKVFMLTPDVFHSVPKEFWKEIVTSPNPAKKIKELCSSQKLTITNSGGILIISFKGEMKNEIQIHPVQPLSQQKISLPIYKERGRKINIHSLLLTLKRILKLTYVILIFIFKSLFYLSKKIFEALKIIIKALAQFLKRFKFFQKLEANLKELPKKPVFQKIKNTINFFKKKRVYVPILCLLIILMGFFAVQYQKRETKMAEWKKILEESRTKYKEGEIALIYGAEDKAIKSFSEVESLIFKLEGSGYFKKESKEIRESTMSKLQKLLNMEMIENPEIVATLGSFSIKFNIQKIALIENESLLFASDPSSALFYKFNLTEKRGEFSLAPIPEGGILKMVPLKIKGPRNLLIFFAPPANIFLYPGDEKKFSESQTLSPPYEDYEFSDLSSFENNLYFLDSKNGEIIKFGLSEENTISSGKIWLKRNTKKVALAKSITCDGSVWILDEKGSILKYANGYFIQALKIPEIFGNPTKIWTSADRPFIYVLDSPKKRLTLLDKKGQLIKQYFSEKFNDLKDFWVSEDGNTLYLLNGNQIFVIKVEL